MNIKQAIEKIKEIFADTNAEKFNTQYQLTDGTIVEVEGSFEVGSKVFVVAEDGLVPAPVGSHTFEDGTVITVEANEEGENVLSNIVLPDPIVMEDKDEEKEEMADEKEEEMEEEEKKDKMETKDELIIELITALEPLVDDIVEMKKEIEEFKKEFKSEFEKFSNEPAGKPVKNNFSKVESTFDKRLAAIAELRKNKK
jgi:hypothetical protein